MNIPVIGLHTPEQIAALQQSTGMLVTIRRSGARLVHSNEFKSMIDDYDLVDRQSYMSTLGASAGDRA